MHSKGSASCLQQIVPVVGRAAKEPQRWTLKRHSWPREAHRVAQEAVIPARLVDMPSPRLCQLTEQRLGVLQHRRVKALGKPTVERCE